MDLKKTFSTMLLTCSLSLSANPVVSVMGEQIEDALQQITFSGDNAQLHFKSGNTLTEDIEDVIVTFSSVTSLGINDASIYVVNTVVKDKLEVSGLNNESVEIYNTQGISLLSFESNFESLSIDVAHLNKGVYFLRVNNKVVKFVKD